MFSVQWTPAFLPQCQRRTQNRIKFKPPLQLNKSLVTCERRERASERVEAFYKTVFCARESRGEEYQSSEECKMSTALYTVLPIVL